MHEFEETETAALAALEPLKAQGLKTLEILAGQLDVDELEDITQNFPFIYIKAAPLRSETQNRVDRLDVTLLLFVGDCNERGGSAPVLGDATSPGVYALLDGARELLHRKRIASDWQPAERMTEDFLAGNHSAGLYVYVAQYRMRRGVARR
ncbi:MAG: DUF1834 family protein [Desulfobacteraceae bacterium]|jgi:phage gp37-like protein